MQKPYFQMPKVALSRHTQKWKLQCHQTPGLNGSSLFGWHLWYFKSQKPTEAGAARLRLFDAHNPNLNLELADLQANKTPDQQC